MFHYSTALELLDSDDRRRGNVLLDLGKVALLAGKDQEAETIYEAAQHWLLQANEEDDGARVATATHGLGLALWRQEKRQEAYAAMEHPLAFFRNSDCVKKHKILLHLSPLL